MQRYPKNNKVQRLWTRLAHSPDATTGIWVSTSSLVTGIADITVNKLQAVITVAINVAMI